MSGRKLEHLMTIRTFNGKKSWWMAKKYNSRRIVDKFKASRNNATIKARENRMKWGVMVVNAFSMTLDDDDDYFSSRRL
ncbi:hypothetical protein PoB_003243900 [Plakobranchus ocellatus]|uniref:Uncharacterized protein n=1 Tax=Plakobranchus ocellatus TaxID=259542 RepID=A0AAV4AHL2_9GAST|nr:hypothetical protein PoB_003243900 [Plakobranchus ocellatus]